MTASSHTGHPRDISDARLAEELARARHPELLADLVALARRHFRFFSRFTSHYLTNPWFAAELAGVPAGARALDIGSGLGPVPIWLAGRGVHVDCVDNHPEVRRPPVADDWTEWGFFDYAAIGPNLRSHHVGVESFRPDAPYDAISSVCVFAHIPRATREQVMAACAGWLAPGGRFAIAVDLLAGTNYLWNRANKQEVAPREEHGSLIDLMASLHALGLRIENPTLHRGLPENRPDLFMVSAVKPG
jgi:SAM-dependent methyltransferase